MSNAKYFAKAFSTAIAVIFSLLAELRAGVFDPIPYEVQYRTTISDDCLLCGRCCPIVKELAGTLVFQQLPVLFPGNLFQITRLDLQDADGEYTVTGSGSLIDLFGSAFSSVHLEIEVNGVAGIQLSAENVEKGSYFPPAFDIAVTEKELHDPVHVYTLRLVAAPQAQRVDYKLVGGEEGSSLTDECVACGRRPITVPLNGTFQLGEIEANPLFTTYKIGAIDFSGDAGGNASYAVKGGGFYRQGGEVALTQQMDLECEIQGQPDIKLSSPMGIVGAPFPEISIELKQVDPVSLVVYTLKIVARPVEKPPPPPFRRGDANADGEPDISDAVAILRWLFVSGEIPSCLEAADTNGDGAHDISDPVFLLLFIFQGGQAPPEPGPKNCGPAPRPNFSCDKYPTC